MSIVADEELDVFFFIGRIDAFDELVLEDGFVDDVADTQDDFEGNAVFPHLVIADEGLEAGDAVFTVVEDVPGHAEGDVFDTLQVIVIGNGQGNGNGTFCQRLFVVGQRRRGNALVGDDDHIPRRRANRRITPVHIDDAAGFAAGQADVIAHVDLFRYQRRNAGKEVGQCILQGQGRCQAAGAESCQERRNGNAIGTEDEKDAHHVDAQIDDGRQDGCRRRFITALGQLVLQKRRCRMGTEKSHRNDDDAVIMVG